MKLMYGAIPTENQSTNSTEIIEKLDILTLKLDDLTIKVEESTTKIDEIITKTDDIQNTIDINDAKIIRKLNRLIKLVNNSESVDEWEIGVQYYVDDLVEYETVVYVCIQSNICYDETQSPDLTPALWNVYNNTYSYEMVEETSNLPSVSLDTYEVTKTILGKEKVKKVKK